MRLSKFDLSASSGDPTNDTNIISESNIFLQSKWTTCLSSVQLQMQGSVTMHGYVLGTCAHA